MDGTASRGDAATYARSNHVHPRDTSRAASDLGITGASVGDFVRISAVDNGKPTAFEKISDPNGNIGIVQNSDTATQNIDKGQYVIWHGALYTASDEIASGAALSTSNLTAVTGGGLNAIRNSFSVVLVTDNTTPIAANTTTDITINMAKPGKKLIGISGYGPWYPDKMDVVYITVNVNAQTARVIIRNLTNNVLTGVDVQGLYIS